MQQKCNNNNRQRSHEKKNRLAAEVDEFFALSLPLFWMIENNNLWNDGSWIYVCKYMLSLCIG